MQVIFEWLANGSPILFSLPPASSAENFCLAKSLESALPLFAAR
jgi:hypothetical protein